MTSDLSNRINIGKDTETKLIRVGIDSFKKLKSIGSKKAFIKLQAIDPGACLSLLYGLEGAIEGVKWNKLSPEKKLSLQRFLQEQKRNTTAEA